MYPKYIKHPLDFLLSLCTIIALSPLLLLLTILGAIKMKGNPFFTQQRPGKDEKIFRLIKFRTMTCETDADGNPLPDEQRLVPYGRFLRSTSLDELPELFNILNGDMAIVGPRPLLVRDMVFMTKEQRKRHTVRQGLTGLAQVSGRNAMTWEDKLDYDQRYVQNLSFMFDFFIVLKTVYKVLKREGITEEGQATAMDLGDYLLANGMVHNDEYIVRQEEAKRILR
jgi:lipopolysaccharide/colanic/teichoic acid biosynthesis glycosyltransferase